MAFLAWLASGIGYFLCSGSPNSLLGSVFFFAVVSFAMLTLLRRCICTSSSLTAGRSRTERHPGAVRGIHMFHMATIQPSVCAGVPQPVFLQKCASWDHVRTSCWWKRGACSGSAVHLVSPAADEMHCSLAAALDIYGHGDCSRPPTSPSQDQWFPKTADRGRQK